MTAKYKPIKKITDMVITGAKKNLAMTEIYAQVIQKDYQGTPPSISAFRTHYGEAYSAAKADLVAEISNELLKNARGGHYQSQAFFLERQGGNYKKVDHLSITESEDDPEEEKNALLAMMNKLGVSEEEGNGG